MKKCNLIGPLKINHSIINFTLDSYFVDGGVAHRRYFNSPCLSFGDGDSSKSNMDVKLNAEKDVSDTLYALNDLKNNFELIYMHGFDGGRMSHQIAIIGDILNMLESKEDRMVHFFQSNTNKWIFSSFREKSYQHCGQFSLFSLKKQKIQLKNARFPKEDEEFQLNPICSHGISNQSESIFSIKAQLPYLLIFD